MKVFFDNCTSPVFASTLDGFLRRTEHEAHHIMDLPCKRNAPDDLWMKMLSDDVETWIVITGDMRIYRNKVLREAYRRAGLRGFVLSSSYQKSPVHQMCSTLIWRWPEMASFIGSLRDAALVEMPSNRTSKFRVLPL